MARQGFRDILAHRLHRSPQELPLPSRFSEAGNTIGGLALRTGKLDIRQIDRILSVQGATEKLFGHIAVDLGFLSMIEVDRLVELQDALCQFEVGEMLFIAGEIDLASLFDAFRQYLDQR